MRRRFALVPFALAAALVVAGCADSPADAESPQDQVAEPAADTAEPADDELVMEAEPGVYGTVTNLDAEWRSVPESELNYLLAPGLELRITQVAQPQSLDIATYEQLTGRVGDGVETVVPAPGEKFLAATYTSTDPRLPIGGGSTPETQASLLIEGSEVTQVFSGSGDRQQDTIVVAIPETAEPEDVVLEAKTSSSRRSDEDVIQMISLIDGSRVDTDIPQAYAMADWEAVEVSDAGTMEFEYERITGDLETIRGSVDTAYLTPLHADHGWPRTDEVFLVVDVDEPENHDNKSIIHVELPDGTVVQPQAENSSLVRAFSDPMVFSVPADAGTVTVVLTPRAKPFTDVLEGDPVEATVTWPTYEATGLAPADD
ncbi:MAG TPA: hypothetical protein VK053_15760 [Jiangellaceae bacterium]|nr:hypothetical protein [Jiangellaceae bacterium]